MHDQATKLIPELSAWNNGNGIDLLSWVGCIGRYDHAIGYAALFWPDFAIHDGCIFLKHPDLKIYQDWMTQTKQDRTAVESVMNHRHIVDILANSEFQPTREVVLHIGRLLKDMWSCKLAREFPEKRITVSFPESESDDLLDYVITVYQERTD